MYKKYAQNQFEMETPKSTPLIFFPGYIPDKIYYTFTKYDRAEFYYR